MDDNDNDNDMDSESNKNLVTVNASDKSVSSVPYLNDSTAVPDNQIRRTYEITLDRSDALGNGFVDADACVPGYGHANGLPRVHVPSRLP